MSCDCMKLVNERLSADNCRLATGFQITKDMGVQMRLLVATEKIDKTRRKPVPKVVASYCPFCGARAEGAK